MPADVNSLLRFSASHACTQPVVTTEKYQPLHFRKKWERRGNARSGRGSDREQREHAKRTRDILSSCTEPRRTGHAAPSTRDSMACRRGALIPGPGVTITKYASHTSRARSAAPAPADRSSRAHAQYEFQMNDRPQAMNGSLQQANASANVALQSCGQPRKILHFAHQLLVEQKLRELLIFRAQDFVEPLAHLARACWHAREPRSNRHGSAHAHRVINDRSWRRASF